MRESTLKSEQKRAAEEVRKAAEKAMKHEKELWQSEGRKKIAIDKELDLRRLQEEELRESKVKSEQKRAAEEVRKAAEKAMKHEQEVWQSEGRKKIAIDKAEDLKRLQEQELIESKLKSEQKRAAEEVRKVAEKAMKHEQEVWQSEGRKKIAIDKAEDLKRLQEQELIESKLKSEQKRAAEEVRKAAEKAMKHEKEVWQSEGRKKIAIDKAEDLKRLEREELEQSRIKSEQARVALSNQKAIEKQIKHEKEVWQSTSRKEVIAAEAQRLKEYERVQIEEARIKSEQYRVALAARRAADKAMKHEVQVWQSEGRKKIAIDKAEYEARLQETELHESKLKSEQVRKAKADRLAAEKAMKHEKEVWQSESRKEVIANEMARLKAYEQVQIEESRIKSEQYRKAKADREAAEKVMKHEIKVWQSEGRQKFAVDIANDLKRLEEEELFESRLKSEQKQIAESNRKAAEKAMKHEIEVWQSESRKEVAIAKANDLLRLEKEALEEARIKSEQLRAAREARKVEAKAIKHEKEAWQSEGRKEFTREVAKDLLRLQEEELKESFLKSEQVRAAREAERVAAKAMKHEQEVWQSEGRKKIAIDKAEDLKRLEAQDIEAYKVKNEAMRVAKEHEAAVAKAVRIERNAHYIEGKRERAAYQKELEQKAYEAEHMASFAGLMNPFAWGDMGDADYSAYD